jgi:50S ribosomal subunit-associated GTPase HflX
VALASAVAARADLALVIHDTSLGEREPPAAPSAREIHVYNKIDLVPAEARSGPPIQNVRPVVFVSAVTGEGLEALLERIASALVPQAPAAGEAVPFTSEQVNVLGAARTAIHLNDPTRALTLLHSMLSSP